MQEFKFIQLWLGTISGNITVSPSTIKANAAYSFTVDTSTTIPAGGYLTVTFPSQVVLSSTPSCTFQFGFTGTPSCSATANVLKIVNGFPSLNGMRFRVTPVQNPGSAQSISGFVFKFYSSLTATTVSDQSAATTFFYQFTTDTLTSAMITPGSYVVGEPVDWTISITPKNQIPAGGLIKLFMPKWNVAALFSIGALSMLAAGSNVCSPIFGLSSSSVTCSFTIDSISTKQDVLTISNAFTTAQSPGSSFDITVSGVRNMPTTKPYSNFELWTLDSGSFGIDTMTGLEIAMTTPATLPSSQVKVIIDSPTTIDALTTYLFTLFINNPIPMGGSIRVKIPSEVGATQLTQVIAEQRINSAVTVSPISSSDPNFVELIGGYPTISDSVPIAGLVAFRFKYLKNPSIATSTSSFQITTYDDGYPIEQITSGLTVLGAAGTITMNSYTYSESRILEYNSFTFDMTVKNILQVGCTIEIKFPTEFVMNNVAISTCVLLATSGLSSSSTCAISQNKLIIQSPFGTVDSIGGERVKFTIANNYIQNPSSTKTTTSAVSVKTISQSGNSIDTWTGTSFRATENTFTQIAITPQSMVAGEYPVAYTFTLRTSRQVEQNAYILVKFPSSDIYVYDTSIASSKCSALQTLSSANFKCSASQTQISFTGGFSNGICQCTGDIQFSVGGIVNARSMKPSDSFIISIYTSDNYLIYQRNTGLQVTMTAANSLTTAKITQSIGKNGQIDNYIFTVYNHNQKYDGDYMVITAPSEVSFTNITTCAARNGVRSFLKCKVEGTNQITIGFQFSRGRILGQVQANIGFEFMIMNVMNPSSMSPSSAFNIKTYTVDDYMISNIANGPQVTNSKPSNMTQVNIKPSVYADGQWTNLTFSVIPSNYIQYMSLQVTIPSDMLTTQGAPKLCQVVSSYSISKDMICDYVAATKTVKISNAFTVLTKFQYDQSSLVLKQLQFTLGEFINPVAVSKSGNFTFTTFDKQGYVIDQQNQSVSYVCSSLCGSCSNDDYTKCTSCLSTTPYKLLFMGQCVQQCPSGTTEAKNKCIVCPNSCQQCSLEDDTCKVCNVGLLYMDGQCVVNCPVGYKFEMPNQCIQEIIPVFSFVNYFQQTESYKCFMFPFSAASVFVIIVLVCAVQCSKRNVNNKRKRIVQIQEKEHQFLTPLRLIEVCIAVISLIELLGWIFFLYCMINVEEKLPFYMICGALGFNLFLNFVMACGIMKSKESFDQYLHSYSEAYVCTYLLIKFFTLFISHKGFYFSFARYQRDTQKTRAFDFSYFESGDEDGISGLCFKFFFMMSILLLHGAVIGACVLNYMANDLSKKLFCLDLDIIGMTTFQALLVLVTLLQCGVQPQQQKIYPEQIEDDKPQFVKLPQTSISQIQRSRHDDEQAIEEDSYIEESPVKGRSYNDDSRKQFKLPAKRVQINDSNDLDGTIEPLDDYPTNRRYGDQRQKRRRPTEEDSQYSTEQRKKKVRPRVSQKYDDDDIIKQEESDSAEDITASMKLKKKNRQRIIQEDLNESEEEQPRRKSTHKSKEKKELSIARFDTIKSQEQEEEVKDIYESNSQKSINQQSNSIQLPYNNEEDNTFNAQDIQQIENEKPQTVSEHVVVTQPSIKPIQQPVIKPTVFEMVSDNAGSSGDEEHKFIDTTRPAFEMVTVHKEMKKLDDEIMQIVEPCYKDLVKQINESSQAKEKPLTPAADMKSLYGSINSKYPSKEDAKSVIQEKQELLISQHSQPKDSKQYLSQKSEIKEIQPAASQISKQISIKETPIQNSQKTQSQDIVQNRVNISAEFGRIAQQVPTQYDSQSTHQNNEIDEIIQQPVFQKIKSSSNNNDANDYSYLAKVQQQNPKQNSQLESDFQQQKSQNSDYIISKKHSQQISKQGSIQQSDQVIDDIFSQKSEKDNNELIKQSKTNSNKSQNQEKSIQQFNKSENTIQVIQNTDEIIQVEDSKIQTKTSNYIDDKIVDSQINGNSLAIIDDNQKEINQQNSDENVSASQIETIQNVINKSGLDYTDQPLEKQKTVGKKSNKSKVGSVNNTNSQQSENLISKDSKKTQRNGWTDQELDKKSQSIKQEVKEIQRINSQDQKALIKQSQQRSKQVLVDQQSDRMETPEIDDDNEELKDQVNKDDIKPKTIIIFSDKSESSVEEMMEDTPSNYNLLNGRLDEESHGLYSQIYKAISKKVIYGNDQSLISLTPGNEDLVAKTINHNERRHSSVDSRAQQIQQTEQQRIDNVKNFIEKAQTSGLGFFIGNHIRKDQQKGLAKHKRNSSIGEIPSNKLIDQKEAQNNLIANMAKHSSEIQF